MYWEAVACLDVEGSAAVSSEEWAVADHDLHW
jgi:hypothetical protein